MIRFVFSLPLDLKAGATNHLYQYKTLRAARMVATKKGVPHSKIERIVFIYGYENGVVVDA